MIKIITLSSLSLLVLGLMYLALYPSVFFRPMPKGLCAAKLADKPNWVSSLVDKSDSHYIEKLPVATKKQQIQCLTHSHPRLVITEEGSAIIGYRRTRVFGFTDWFCLTPNGDITSSATLGHYDFSVNREFVSKLRACLE